jgi:hypothetical protein
LSNVEADEMDIQWCSSVLCIREGIWL